MVFVADFGGVLPKLKPLNIARLNEAAYPRQSVRASDSLTLVSCSDIVGPESFLPTRSGASRESGENVTRHIEVLNHAWWRR